MKFPPPKLLTILKGTYSTYQGSSDASQVVQTPYDENKYNSK